MVNKYKELQKEKFTPEEKARWSTMLVDTWQAIGGDVEQAFEDQRRWDPKAKLTRAIIVEAVLDANRVQDYGHMTNEEYAFLGAIYHRPSFQKWAREVLNY